MAQYTFADIIDSYIRKIGEEVGNTTEDRTADILPRLNENYWSLLRQTGASWQQPTTLTLAAVTPTTNKHKLVTALGLSTGEVLSIDEVRWRGVPLLEWDKGKIDSLYAANSASAGIFPTAYALWWDGDDSYISFYPCVESANAVDCKITWSKRPAKIAAETESPIFGDTYAMVLAEEMAQEFLLNSADAKLSNVRMVKHENDKRKMTNHFLSMRPKVDDPARPTPLGYGEWSDGTMEW